MKLSILIGYNVELGVTPGFKRLVSSKFYSGIIRYFLLFDLRSIVCHNLCSTAIKEKTGKFKFWGDFKQLTSNLGDDIIEQG